MTTFRLFFLIFIVAYFGMHTSFAQSIAHQEDKTEVSVKPTVKVHGRIQYDFEFLNQKNYYAPGENYHSKGQEFRRAYLSASGSIYNNIKYKFQLEFAGGIVAYRDMYVKFTKIPGIGGNLALGSVAEVTGLDMATSSKYITFMERSMMTSTQGFRWNSGFHYSNFDILKGKLGFQLSYTFNGRHVEGFKVKKLGDGSHIVARLTSPIYQNKAKNYLVHIGVNFEHRKYTSDPKTHTLRFRNENHMGYVNKVVFDSLKMHNDIGFELAANFGSLSFQGEYEIADYHTVENGNPQVHSYYVAVSYFVFGGHRGYKNGAGSRVKPFSNFSIQDRNFGALELAIRYSEMGADGIITGSTNEDIGEIDKIGNITVGLNWYLNSHTRLMYNFVTSNFQATGNVDRLNANLLRLQVDF